VVPELVDEIRRLRHLVSYLWLYVDRHVWTQLTTPQKELFADVLDDYGRRADVEEGYVGTDMAHHPVDRWWRG
jgi:hypothetical protein